MKWGTDRRTLKTEFLMTRSPKTRRSEIIGPKDSLGLEPAGICVVTRKSALLEQYEKEQRKLELSALRIPREGCALCFLLRGAGDVLEVSRGLRRAGGTLTALFHSS